MRTLFIADIHANLTALQALPAADQVICAGDLVGYGFRPAEVIASLRERDALCVRGDEDDAIANGVDHVVPPELAEAARETRVWTARQLSRANLSYLGTLPPELERMIDGVRIAVTHAYPGDYERYIDPTAEQLDRIAHAYPHADLIVLGHTHRAGMWRVRNTTIVNPGSLGQPEHAGYGTYVLLADGRLHFGRVQLDIGPMLREIDRRHITATAIHQCEDALVHGARRPHDRVERRAPRHRRDAPAASA